MLKNSDDVASARDKRQTVEVVPGPRVPGSGHLYRPRDARAVPASSPPSPVKFEEPRFAQRWPWMIVVVQAAGLELALGDEQARPVRSV